MGPFQLMLISYEIQYNTSDKSHNIQNELPLEMPCRLNPLDTGAKYHKNAYLFLTIMQAKSEYALHKSRNSMTIKSFIILVHSSQATIYP